MELTLEFLGLTKEQLQDLVVEQLCRKALTGTLADEDGNEVTVDTRLQESLKKMVKERIDSTVSAVAEKHVLPNVTKYIEDLILQETTTWGEKKGAPVTFIEYLVQRADAYMREEVNLDGKSRKDSDSYSWSGSKQTRITYLVHHHLQYSIATAMKQALDAANQSIVGGIYDAVKLKLNEFATALTVAVKPVEKR